VFCWPVRFGHEASLACFTLGAACCLCVCGLSTVASSCMLVSEFVVCSQWLLVASFVHRYIYPCAAIAECLAGRTFCHFVCRVCDHVFEIRF
jgi:hypothetical protein